MANFAELDSNNVVKRVVVIHNNESPTEEAGINFLKNLYGADTNWKQTSYNTFGGVHYTDGSYTVPSEDQSKAFRMNYAGVNFTYNEEKDAFILPQPFPSWTLNESTCQWEAPIAYPGVWGSDVEGKYVWNEETQSWDDYPKE